MSTTAGSFKWDAAQAADRRHRPLLQVADRLGRTTITIAALAVSGTCSLAVGWLFSAHPGLVVLVCLVWGLAVTTDSAQFSACASEVCWPEYIGRRSRSRRASACS